MCSWGWFVCIARRVFSTIAHVLGDSELEELCVLRVRSLWGFLEVVRQFVVNFLIGELFSTCVNFMALSFMSLSCYVFMNVHRFLIMHVRLVLEGGLANLYGMVWATCMRGMGVMVPFEVPSFANESTISLNSFVSSNFLDCYIVSKPC